MAARGLSQVVAAGVTLLLLCTGFLLRWFLVLQSVGSADVAWALQSTVSAAGVHGLSCPMACGVFPSQGWNPCPLHWQADS